MNDKQDRQIRLREEQREFASAILGNLERSKAVIEEIRIAEWQHCEEVKNQLNRLAHETDTIVPSAPANTQSIRLNYAADTIVPVESFWNSFEYGGLQQRFLVCRLGSTGSAFLAKLIKTHPDVFCSHEGILWNRHSLDGGQSEREQQNFLAYICSDAMHHAYKASGDIGSAWRNYLQRAPKHCSAGNSGPLLRTGILHRHPLRVLKTQQHIAAHEPVSLPAHATRLMADYFKATGIDCDIEGESEIANQHFIWTCFLWRDGAISGERLDVQIHIEKLNELEYAQEKLQSLTGVEYSGDLISPLLGKVVNTRTGEVEPVEAIYANLPQSYQHWYRAIVDDVADSIGYSR